MKIGELQGMILEELIKSDINYGCLERNQVKILSKGFVLLANRELNEIASVNNHGPVSVAVILPKTIPKLINPNSDYVENPEQFWIDFSASLNAFGINSQSQQESFVSDLKNEIESNLNILNLETIESLLQHEFNHNNSD